ncbi:MAG: hypothetical protein WBI04_04310 [Trichlorobacter sp.]|jgi:methyl-accepting chemotaxis protein
MTSPHCDQLQRWHSLLTPIMELLQRLAGTTEHQFLQLGERLQDFSLRSCRISASAGELVQLVAGDESSQLTTRLRTLFTDIDTYLNRIRTQSNSSCHTLEQVMSQLDQVVQPLEGFQKMDKALRMLSISTKIESARLGELGAGFTTLALDVEKLSLTVSQKSSGIMGERQNLMQLITENLETSRRTEASQHADAQTILTGINASLETMAQLNQACSDAGNRVGLIAEEVVAETGTVVSSMQFHDITRQQIEHIFEALEKIQQHACQRPDDVDKTACDTQVAEIGDICELQTAQLRHATSQLFQATTAILESLQDIGAKQSQISQGLQQALMGNDDSADASLLTSMQGDMQRVTAILQRCAASDQKLAQAMGKVTGTIGDIASFVSDIEAVGSEIDLIALNAQIKAAHTGPQGAALGVLAEAIKRLSLDAVVQTEAVSSNLRAINEATGQLKSGGPPFGSATDNQVTVMEQETRQIIAALNQTNQLLRERLAAVAAMAESLAEDINATTCGFHVHEESKQQAERAASALEQIYSEARQLVPASSEFRTNLQHMEQRYTMESERLIHEMLAARHGVQLALKREETSSGAGSEYGDNIDLF